MTANEIACEMAFRRKSTGQQKLRKWVRYSLIGVMGYGVWILWSLR